MPEWARDSDSYRPQDINHYQTKRRRRLSRSGSRSGEDGPRKRSKGSRSTASHERATRITSSLDTSTLDYKTLNEKIDHVTGMVNRLERKVDQLLEIIINVCAPSTGSSLIRSCGTYVNIHQHNLSSSSRPARDNQELPTAKLTTRPQRVLDDEPISHVRPQPPTDSAQAELQIQTEKLKLNQYTAQTPLLASPNKPHTSRILLVLT